MLGLFVAGRLLRVPEVVDLWLEFEALAPDYSDDPENDFFNMHVALNV